MMSEETNSACRSKCCRITNTLPKLFVDSKLQISKLTYEWSDSTLTSIKGTFGTVKFIPGGPVPRFGKVLFFSKGNCIYINQDEQLVGQKEGIIFHNYKDHEDEINAFLENLSIIGASLETFNILKEAGKLKNTDQFTIIDTYFTEYNRVRYSNTFINRRGYGSLNEKSVKLESFRKDVNSGYSFAYYLFNNVFITNDPKVFKGRLKDIVIIYNQRDMGKYEEFISQVELFQNSDSYEEYVKKIMNLD